MTQPSNVESSPRSARSGDGLRIALAWLVVSAPLLWGVYETLKKALQLFH